MRIAIDGYALGLKKGTGLTTYARELARTLIRQGQIVDVIYGVNGIGRRPQLRQARLLQALALRGEAMTHAWHSWGPRVPIYALAHLLRHSLRLHEIPESPWQPMAAAPQRFSGATRIYNLPSVFRAAQVIGSLSEGSLRLRAPSGIDVFHLTSPLPVRMLGVPNIVTVHDAIPLLLPDSTAINLRHYERIMKASVRHADAVLSVSEHSKHDLVRLFGLPEEVVHVTYQSVDIPATIREVKYSVLKGFLKSSFNLELGQYLLFLGAIEPKKNLTRLLDAHAIAYSDLPLVVAGGAGWLCDEPLARLKRLDSGNGSTSGVRQIDYLPYRQLMYLLKGARAVVFPSLYEGFGLPVLEAMQMGVPVITSGQGALKEIAGDAAIFVDPRDTDAIAHAIDIISEDDEIHAALIAKGLARARFFSPERHYQRLEAVYRRVASAG